MSPCRSVPPFCHGALASRKMLFAFVNSSNCPQTLSLVGNDQHGRTKILDPSFSNALRHRPGSLVQYRNAQLVQRAPTHHVAENDFGIIRRLNLKKVHTKCFVEAKGPRQRCWKPRFLEDALWTHELSSHVVENLEEPSRIHPCSGAHNCYGYSE